MEITIDGKVLSFTDSDKSIIDVADKGGITILSPCYRGDKGCCKVSSTIDFRELDCKC